MLVTPAAFRALEPHLDPAWLVLVAEPAIVNGVTGFKFHRGCLALVRRPGQPLPLSAFAQARRLVLLEAVGNPDNIGGIFRSAAALGAEARSARSRLRRPVLPQGRAHVHGRGAALALRSRRSVAARPRRLCATWALRSSRCAPTGELTLDDVRGQAVSQMRGWRSLAGAEGHGLSTAAMAAADMTVRIPVDPRSDSLNVVVAVSIALQRLSTQTFVERRNATRPH